MDVVKNTNLEESSGKASENYYGIGRRILQCNY
jgi:hypothetical protein